MIYRWSWVLLLFMMCIYGCEPARPVPDAGTTTSNGTAPTPQPVVSDPQRQPTAAAPQKETNVSKDAATSSPKIAVACASDLRFVMPELEQEFHQQHPGIVIAATFGSSGNLFAQISNSAPFDVFLSADIQYPQKLADQGLTVPDSLFRYAVGHIVVWVRKDSPLDVEKMGVEVLKDPSVKKVAIANPKLAPYGRAAEAALKSLNVYDAIHDKLVLGENISQTAQFAETGAADVAVLAMSIAVAPNFVDNGRYWKIPLDAYPRLEQGGVILKATQQAAASRDFCEFLKSKAAQTIFTKHGFVLPEAE